MNRLRDFLAVYRLYRQAHPVSYSITTAWRITVQGLPF